MNLKLFVKRIIIDSLLLGLLLIAMPSMAGDATQGKAKAAPCAACHGQTGISTASIWPNLAGQGEQYLIKQINDIKSNVRQVPTMTAFVTNLSNEDIADISAFYASQPQAISGAQELVSKAYNLNAEEHLALGQKIYRSGNPGLGIPTCSACHSPSGKGNAPAKYPQVGGQQYEYLVQQLKDFRGNIRVNDGESRIMRSAVENLKDIELEAVANYMSGLH